MSLALALPLDTSLSLRRPQLSSLKSETTRLMSSFQSERGNTLVKSPDTESSRLISNKRLVFVSCFTCTD